MKLQLRKAVCMLLALTVLLSAGLLLVAAWNEQQMSKPLGLERIVFLGSYQTDTDANPIAYTSQTVLNAAKNRKVVFTGHFNQELIDGHNILLRIQNLRVKIFRNGELIYSFGEPGSFLSISKSPGNVWQTFNHPSISVQDEIRIELESIYANNPKLAYNDFIGQILAGDSGILFHLLLKKIGATVLLGGGVFLMGCILLAVVLILKLLKTPISPKIFHFGMFSIVSGIWFFLDFQIVSLVIPLGVFNNILSMICLCLITPFLLLYILDFLETQKTRKMLEVVVFIQIVFTLFYLTMQSMGIYDGFELLTPLIILLTAGIGLAWGCLVHEYLCRHRSDVRLLLLSGSVLLLCIDDARAYMTDFNPQYTMTKAAFSLFLAIQFLYSVYCVRKSIGNVNRAGQLEDELAQSRIAIAISQIQPHFLYNSLTAIKQLCAVDPPRAERAIGAFSSFLRGNLDSISSTLPIPFDRELTHIQNYLSLEKLRFGKRLNVIYGIQTSEFLIPSLTVQPLVENAVRYGVTKKAGGGTVSLFVKEEESRILIEVCDDGVGFDPDKQADDERSHIGIQNVRKRLQAQCGGTLAINSEEGKGTTVTISIKKGVKKG